MKKKLLLVALLLAIAAPGFADEGAKAVETLARSLMTARQAGAPLNELMELFDRVYEESNKNKYAADRYSLSCMIAHDAWDSPIVADKSDKSRVIAEFGRKWYWLCQQ